MPISKLYANSALLDDCSEGVSLLAVIKVQAFMRKVLARISIRDQIEVRESYRMHARYFTRQEQFETLSRDRTLSVKNSPG